MDLDYLPEQWPEQPLQLPEQELVEQLLAAGQPMHFWPLFFAR